MTLQEYIVRKGTEQKTRKGDRLWFDKSEIILCKRGLIGEYRGNILVDVYTRKEFLYGVHDRGVALSEGSIYTLPIKKIPLEFHEEIKEALIKRNLRLLERLSHLTDGDVETRLQNLLSSFGVRYGMFTGKTTFIPLSLPRQRLAEMLNCRSETVTRIITKWKKSGVVDFRKEGIELMSVQEPKRTKQRVRG